jgi:multidrug efflux pump subunit AcrB
MKIVRFALRFPHTFYVLAGLILFLGCSAILVTPKDIFPTINIPVVTVIWQETGLSPLPHSHILLIKCHWRIS